MELVVRAVLPTKEVSLQIETANVHATLSTWSTRQVSCYGTVQTRAGECRHWFSRSYRHRMAAGSENCLVVTGHETLTSWRPTAFVPPRSLLTPLDTTFDPPTGGSMPGWWTSSGHIVVKPRINGHELGYLILDTGEQGGKGLGHFGGRDESLSIRARGKKDAAVPG